MCNDLLDSIYKIVIAGDINFIIHNPQELWEVYFFILDLVAVNQNIKDLLNKVDTFLT